MDDMLVSVPRARGSVASMYNASRALAQCAAKVGARCCCVLTKEESNACVSTDGEIAGLFLGPSPSGVRVLRAGLLAKAVRASHCLRANVFRKKTHTPHVLLHRRVGQLLVDAGAVIDARRRRAERAMIPRV